MLASASTPLIVRAGPPDLDDLLPLFEGYLAFYGRHSDCPQQARTYLGDRLALDDAVVLLARNPAGKALGFAQLFPSFTSLGMARTWVLNDLYVAAHSRHGGVGQALLQAVIEFARVTGRAQVVLETGVDNHRARALYERAGFTATQGFVGYGLRLAAAAPGSDRRDQVAHGVPAC